MCASQTIKNKSCFPMITDDNDKLMINDKSHKLLFFFMFCIIRSMGVTLWNYIANIFPFLRKEIIRDFKRPGEKKTKTISLLSCILKICIFYGM